MNIKRFTIIAALALASMSVAACERAQANQQTLITDDCGQQWDVIAPGGVVPARIGYCSYRVTVPNYPMQGDSKFRTSFKDRVIADINIGYEYNITDARKFISEAKYIGRPNTEGDDATNASKAYESAENVVIDKRLRDLTSELLIQEDIVEFNQGEFEDVLLDKINQRLATRGVQLSFISFVPTPETQTRQAIDIATAARVYESKGLATLGASVMTARAGAPSYTVNVAPATAPEKE